MSKVQKCYIHQASRDIYFGKFQEISRKSWKPPNIAFNLQVFALPLLLLQELRQNGHSPQLRGEVGPAGHDDTDVDNDQVVTDTGQVAAYTNQSFSLLQMTTSRANGLSKWLSKTNVIGG